MTIQDFEQHIDAVALQRGKEYFSAGSVLDLEEGTSGNWTADVEENELYLVSVTIKRQKIAGWECDCPHNADAICEHVAAVLYAIEARLQQQKPKNTGKEKKSRASAPNTRKTIENIIEKASTEEIATFLLSRFKSDKKLKPAFFVHFADLVDGDISTKYHSLITDIWESGRGRHNYVDTAAARQIAGNLSRLTKRAHELLEKKNITESLALGKALLEVTASALDRLNYYYDTLEDALDKVMRLLLAISSQAPPMMKEDLFSYFIHQAKQRHYYRVDQTGYEILLIISSLVADRQQEQEFLQTIDSMLMDKESYMYGLPELVEIKIAFFRKRNRTEEGRALMEQYKKFPVFREMLVREAIQMKQYDIAKALCHEAIAAAKGNEWASPFDQWENILLEIAIDEGSTSDIRAMAEKLYFHSYGNTTYYRAIRSTYPEENWVERREELIQQIKKSGWEKPRKSAFLASIFSEEEDNDRLLELLRDNTDNLNFIEQYAEALLRTHTAEILQCYEEGIFLCAVQANRTQYQNIAYHLRRMLLIPGGEEKARKIAQTLRDKYKSRFTMHAAIDEVFFNKKLLKATGQR